MRLLALISTSLAALSLLLPLDAFAQDGAPPANAPPPEKGDTASTGMFSLSVERLGGLSYAKASQTDGGDASASLFTMGIGVAQINPYAVPRVGVDYVLSSGLSLGASAGLMRWSGSSSNG